METFEKIQYNLQHLKQLVFEVTDHCNLNCEYCALSDFYVNHDKREEQYLSFRKVQLVIDYILSIRDNAYDVYYPLMVSFYGGEPLLNMALIKQTIDYVKYLSTPKRYITYGLTTNAMLLDKYMDYLVENKFYLTISLDGDEMGQSYRVDHSGKNSFNRVFKNIQLLRDKHPEYFKNYVLFNSVLHNRNNVETTLRFIKDHFDRIPFIVPLNPVGIRKEKINEFMSIFQNIQQSILRSENCEAIEAEMFVHSPRISMLVNHVFWKTGNTFDSYNDLIFDIIQNSPSQTGTCSPFSKKMFITVNGKILQCERIGQEFVLGQVYDDRIELDLDSVANTQNQYISKIAEQCSSCCLKKQCSQCIYQIDDIYNENACCLSYCDKENNDQIENETIDFLREHPYLYDKIYKEVTIKF